MVAQNNNVLLTCTVQAKGVSSLCLFMRRITRHRRELIFSVKYMASDPGCSAHMRKYTPQLPKLQHEQNNPWHVCTYFTTWNTDTALSINGKKTLHLQLATCMIFYTLPLSIPWKYIMTRSSQAPKRTKKAA